MKNQNLKQEKKKKGNQKQHEKNQQARNLTGVHTIKW
jgi:hypothetical protein